MDSPTHPLNVYIANDLRLAVDPSLLAQTAFPIEISEYHQQKQQPPGWPQQQHLVPGYLLSYQSSARETSSGGGEDDRNDGLESSHRVEELDDRNFPGSVIAEIGTWFGQEDCMGNDGAAAQLEVRSTSINGASYPAMNLAQDFMAHPDSLQQANEAPTNAPQLSSTSNSGYASTAPPTPATQASSPAPRRPTSKKTRKPRPDRSKKAAFVCPFEPYGCKLRDFSSKNEFKRHVHSQHMQPGLWKCDLCPSQVGGCSAPALSSPDEGSGSSRKKRLAASISRGHATRQQKSKSCKTFKRKDLFIQHMRRMHPDVHGESPTTEKNEMPPELVQASERCFLSVNSLPEKSICVYCNRRFEGKGTWPERMEHVGKHMELGEAPCRTIDRDLEEWAHKNNVIKWDDSARKYELVGNHRRQKKGHKKTKTNH